ncbi:MAG: bifunctional diguanylate cyclase/phosphodiesterase [Sphaerochaetaceae bacterium]|nr:bifunctional diguanylate cyclase/phosphodiesterase [Sphaerochaetaceae bacterium]NLO60573.1 bifunctional diguanylate cyclase/phosphodiesterase [Spirochaetales bacterium]MDD3671248.1 bifunctional diguanylate cyclase/phosphodiesterase [Sphaerochaetaceae bacterium]MDD4259513.1 bifunctional diguanylate cyclase/phosphodiesterase [Sphaerochaetaceae bacterium]MDD4841651.1 bifunctional diguanylate cyclase/phosphodiesterase [Sphaerochaetaceae bacterium]
MIDHFGADLVTLAVLVVLLVDTLKNRNHSEAIKEHLVINAIISSILTVSFLAFEAIFEGIEPLSTWIQTGYLAFLPLSILCWSTYVLLDVPKTLVVKTFGHYVSIFIIFLIIVTTSVDLTHPIGTRLAPLVSLIASSSIIMVTLVKLLSHIKQVHESHRNISLILLAAFIVALIVQSTYEIKLILTIVLAFTPLIVLRMNQQKLLAYDPLTQLRNRPMFMNQSTKILQMGNQGCVIVIDLVNFKYFNQRFGQQVGDSLLIEIGAFLMSTTPGRMAYRYGPDQFAVILKKSKREEALDAARIIAQRFESAWITNSINVRIRTYIAIVIYPEQVCTGGQLINAIDLTLSKAKTSQERVPVMYDEQFLKAHQREQEIESALRRALADLDIVLYYQPIFSCTNNMIVAAEALLRIEDPVLGFLSPADFMPVAESSGLIVDLTYLIVQKICNVFNGSFSSNCPLLHVHINLAAIHFLHPMMEHRLLRIIQDNGLPPSKFTFELTESMVVESFERVSEVMKTMAEAGTNFAMDDYGNGYSNIESLAMLPFSIVKLDKSLVDHSTSENKVFESVVGMLKQIGKIVIAEGIESKQHIEAVKNADVDFMQGYYCAKPMPEDEFIEYIKKQGSKV